MILDKIRAMIDLKNEGRQSVPETVRPFGVEIIDERYFGNVLSDPERPISISKLPGFMPYSGEGFAENVAKQEELADFVFSRFLRGKKSAFLDAGFGSNIHVSNRMASLGAEAFALDQLAEHAGIGDIWDRPTRVKTNFEKVNICRGDVARIAENGSVLKNKLFGLILFNGSWDSSGNNWTISGEVMEARYHSRSDGKISMNRYMSEQKDAILRGCVGQLEEQGVVGIVSPRYAFHGGGYDFRSLSEEKMVFFDAIERLNRIGAKKFSLVGLSREGFHKVMEISIRNSESSRLPKAEVAEINEVVGALEDITKLPIEDTYSRYGDDKDFQIERNQRVKQFALSHPELQGITRIDAVFAEF